MPGLLARLSAERAEGILDDLPGSLLRGSLRSGPSPQLVDLVRLEDHRRTRRRLRIWAPRRRPPSSWPPRSSCRSCSPDSPPPHRRRSPWRRSGRTAHRVGNPDSRRVGNPARPRLPLRQVARRRGRNRLVVQPLCHERRRHDEPAVDLADRAGSDRSDLGGQCAVAGRNPVHRDPADRQRRGAAAGEGRRSG